MDNELKSHLQSDSVLLEGVITDLERVLRLLKDRQIDVEFDLSVVATEEAAQADQDDLMIDDLKSGNRSAF